jgi:hypothetical protein
VDGTFVPSNKGLVASSIMGSIDGGSYGMLHCRSLVFHLRQVYGGVISWQVLCIPLLDMNCNENLHIREVFMLRGVWV